MDINQHTSPDKLLRYSFLWSIARLILAAVAMFLGGYPLVAFFGILFFSTLLPLCWLISGIASVYLLYKWNQGGKKVFGGNDKKDNIAFWIMIVSGINLGLVPVINQNIGMGISSNRVVFIVVGALYLLSAYHLHKRWKSHGEKLF